MKDIAKELGISTTSVSRVLNNSEYVSEELRKRVNETVKKTNYQTNAIARSLKTNKTNTIGMLIPDISNSYFMRIGKGLEDGLLNSNYNIIFASTNEDKKREQKLLKILSEQRVNFIVLATVGNNEKMIYELLKNNTSVILIDRKVNGLTQKLDMVLENNYIAIQNLTQKIISLNHKNIGVIAGPLDVSTGFERLQGLKETFKKNKIKIQNKNIFYGDFTTASGKKAFEYFMNFNKVELPMAYISLNNNMTQGFINDLVKTDSPLNNKIVIASYGEIESQIFLSKDRFIAVKQKPYEMGLKVSQIIRKKIFDKNTTKNIEVEYFTPKITFGGKYNG